MCFGIVASDPRDWTAMAIRSSFEGEGHDAKFMNFSDLSAYLGGGLRLWSQNIDLTELEGVVVRDMGRGKPHDVAFRFEMLSALEKLGVPVANPPRAIAKAANKFATSLALQCAGIPSPRTVVTSSIKQALEALAIQGKSVSKPLFGYKGRGIALLTKDDEAALRSILDAQGIAYLQEFIDQENPRDIRVFVVGEEVLGAIYRVAPPGSWISNLAMGGKPQACPITDEMSDLSVKASMAVEAVYSGVDLLETPEGLKVIEVNGTPSGKGIFQALGVDVTKAIVRHIIKP